MNNLLSIDSLSHACHIRYQNSNSNWMFRDMGMLWQITHMDLIAESKKIGTLRNSSSIAISWSLIWCAVKGEKARPTNGKLKTSNQKYLKVGEWGICFLLTALLKKYHYHSTTYNWIFLRPLRGQPLRIFPFSISHQFPFPPTQICPPQILSQKRLKRKHCSSFETVLSASSTLPNI